MLDVHYFFFLLFQMDCKCLSIRMIILYLNEILYDRNYKLLSMILHSVLISAFVYLNKYIKLYFQVNISVWKKAIHKISRVVSKT